MTVVALACWTALTARVFYLLGNGAGRQDVAREIGMKYYVR